jgi:hypothetical protein
LQTTFSHKYLCLKMTAKFVSEEDATAPCGLKQNGKAFSMATRRNGRVEKFFRSGTARWQTKGAEAFLTPLAPFVLIRMLSEARSRRIRS